MNNPFAPTNWQNVPPELRNLSLREVSPKSLAQYGQTSHLSQAEADEAFRESWERADNSSLLSKTEKAPDVLASAQKAGERTNNQKVLSRVIEDYLQQAAGANAETRHDLLIHLAPFIMENENSQHLGQYIHIATQNGSDNIDALGKALRYAKTKEQVKAIFSVGSDNDMTLLHTVFPNRYPKFAQSARIPQCVYSDWLIRQIGKAIQENIHDPSERIQWYTQGIAHINDRDNRKIFWEGGSKIGDITQESELLNILHSACVSTKSCDEAIEIVHKTEKVLKNLGVWNRREMIGYFQIICSEITSEILSATGSSGTSPCAAILQVITEENIPNQSVRGAMLNNVGFYGNDEMMLQALRHLTPEELPSESLRINALTNIAIKKDISPRVKNEVLKLATKENFPTKYANLEKMMNRHIPGAALQASGSAPNFSDNVYHIPPTNNPPPFLRHAPQALHQGTVPTGAQQMPSRSPHSSQPSHAAFPPLRSPAERQAEPYTLPPPPAAMHPATPHNPVQYEEGSFMALLYGDGDRLSGASAAGPSYTPHVPRIGGPAPTMPPQQNFWPQSPPSEPPQGISTTSAWDLVMGPSVRPTQSYNRSSTPAPALPSSRHSGYPAWQGGPPRASRGTYYQSQPGAGSHQPRDQQGGGREGGGR